MVLLFTVIGCIGKKSIDASKLVERNGIYYEVDKTVGYTGSVKEYYGNGQLKAEGNFKNGSLEGVAKTYYKNGQLLSERNFKNGKQEGTTKGYYESGQLKAEVNYKNGEQE